MKRLFIISLLILNSSLSTLLLAQEFSVVSFKQLANDVTAFITPVLDIEGEPCALVRVVGSKDFEFSTPLGIRKRTNLTGEILIYLPGGSKKITIKHPQWGVLRDYRFPQALQGQHSYELTIKEPEREGVVVHDTITQTVTDTITIVHQRPRIPLKVSGIATVALMQGDIAIGGMVAIAGRHGAYIHPQWNMHGSMDFMHECDSEGRFANGSTPYYTGKVHRSSFSVTAGAVHRLSALFSIYEGIGWGHSTTYWQMIDTDGTMTWTKNNGRTHKGVAIEIGTIMSLGRWKCSLGVTTVEAKAWAVNIGVGI